ncbi:hypothetical protein BBJ28_00002898 [Nothophytophthora sp. Chile5]|nr:hypothetical protein BBJ28_00002898 [Nothophytophthora sp. Chile5]
MADMESASAAGGGKRKHKENAFTAKAETGTLKVKIMRRDLPPYGGVGDGGDVSFPPFGDELDAVSSTSTTSSTGKTRQKRGTKQPPSSPDSPPKPRPNRKHVPIFYQQHHRQQIKRAAASGAHSSTDESVASQSSSTTGLSGLHSTSSTSIDYAAASTSSTTSTQPAGRYSSLLSDLRLQSASTSGGDLSAPPQTNPLFARNDSDGLGTLGDLLRPYFPPPSSGPSPSFQLLGATPAGTTSAAGFLLDQTGPPSALHQLASSSASYRSALDALSSATLASSSSAVDMDASTSSSSAAAATTGLLTTSASTETPHSTSSDDGGMEKYRFNPLSALQSAIEHAHRVSLAAAAVEPTESTRTSASRDVSATRQQDGGRGTADSPDLQASGSSAPADGGGNSSLSSDLGPPPYVPPPFMLQNSLAGGGISGWDMSKLPSTEAGGWHRDANTKSSSIPTSEADDQGDMTTALGSPPDAPPPFMPQNSLMGGGIALMAPPKMQLSLERLCSETSVASDSSSKSTGKTGLDSAVSAPPLSGGNGADVGSAVPDLGPPPMGPPAFTIGNSLMGGGIELQPAVANVSTRNFDWKVGKAAAATSADPAATTTSHSKLGLRLRQGLSSRSSVHQEGRASPK